MNSNKEMQQKWDELIERLESLKKKTIDEMLRFRGELARAINLQEKYPNSEKVSELIKFCDNHLDRCNKVLEGINEKLALYKEHKNKVGEPIQVGDSENTLGIAMR